MKLVALLATALLTFAEMSDCDRASAQTYPERPVTIIVPSPAGGGVDIIARLIAPQLSKAVGQQVVILNSGGGNGNIGTLQAARATPDGYTLLLTNSGNHVTNPGLYPSLQWHPIRDFESIAMVFRAPFVLVAKKDLQSRSLTELVTYAKANPQKLNYASPGIGSGNHIAVELLSQIAGMRMTHIPYRGGAAAVTDLLAGMVDLFANTPQSLVGMIENGSIKGLAIASKVRHPLLPNIPTSTESGVPGWEAEAWYALYAPAGTPAPTIEMLAREMEKIVTSADFKTRAAQGGGAAEYKGPKELRQYTASELEFWGKIIQTVGIKLE